jgi:hypothetical protein
LGGTFLSFKDRSTSPLTHHHYNPECATTKPSYDAAPSIPF